MKTLTVHVCSDCKHRDQDHGRSGTNDDRCSFGWCPCLATQADVVENNPGKAETPRPAYDVATGKWAS